MTSGIHHITAIASDASKAVEFYSRFLGLRLVKKTVNQDDVGTYHLFFGDKVGHPGMDLTFFIFKPAFSGSNGNGFVTKVSLAVPEDSLGFWDERFTAFHIEHKDISKRFGKKCLEFSDFDGSAIELVGVNKKELGKTTEVWVTPEVSISHAVRSFHSATLSVPERMLVEPILASVFGYKHTGEEKNTHVYTVSGSSRAATIEIYENTSGGWGMGGAGTVHHIAFRAKDAAQQSEMREKVIKLGLAPTTVIDRFYFRSVYFRIPAGILFEIATDGPGFTADEKEEDLGKYLALPPFLEPQRAMIESNLPVVSSNS